MHVDDNPTENDFTETLRPYSLDHVAEIPRSRRKNRVLEFHFEVPD